MGSPTRRANDAAGFALCLCVYRHLSRFDAAYSPYCLEGCSRKSICSILHSPTPIGPAAVREDVSSRSAEAWQGVASMIMSCGA